MNEKELLEFIKDQKKFIDSKEINAKDLKSLENRGFVIVHKAEEGMIFPTLTLEGIRYLAKL